MKDGQRLVGIHLAVDPRHDPFADADEQVGRGGNEKFVVALVINADDFRPVGEPGHDLVDEIVPVVKMKDVGFEFLYDGSQCEKAAFVQVQDFIVDAIGQGVFVKAEMGPALHFPAIIRAGPAREIVLVIPRVSDPGARDVGEAASAVPGTAEIDLQDFFHRVEGRLSEKSALVTLKCAA